LLIDKIPTQMASSKKLAVVFMDPKPQLKLEDYPFAAVIALADGEIVASKARVCLAATHMQDGSYEFADGVLAVKDSCQVIGGYVDWPHLVAALSHEAKAFSGLVNTSTGEPSFLRVMNLVDHGYTATPPSQTIMPPACTALNAIMKWNEWETSGTEWRVRLADVNQYKEKYETGSGDKADHMTDLLRKLCSRVGLTAGVRIDSKARSEELCNILDQAFQLHVRVREKLLKS